MCLCHDAQDINTVTSLTFLLKGDNERLSTPYTPSRSFQVAITILCSFIGMMIVALSYNLFISFTHIACSHMHSYENKENVLNLHAFTLYKDA